VPQKYQRLGDFEILREIGRGGMGVVFEARQISLNRKVALKVLSGSLGLTPTAVQRFRREAEAAGKLHHTNIVPVYTTDEEDGSLFYAMELIEGPSLDRVIRELRSTKEKKPEPFKPVDEQATTEPYVSDSSQSADGTTLSVSSLSSDSRYFDNVARMIADVADALDHAHKQGVIHRDIKPSNLLLSPDGRLSINDFGLARMLEQPGMTMTGEFVGTPRYMSPEQIAVGRIPLDHRTDIFSLGATLYELLTLQPPFTGERRDQVLAQILHKDPLAPRKLDKKVALDLETICLKAIDKDPDRRYQTAAAMADDLRRYVNRFAISARRAGPLQRTVKWVRRRPALAGALLLALIFTGIAGFALYRADLAERERRLEREGAALRLRDEEQRGRQRLLEEKIRSAYLIAAGGDLHKTDEAIKEIESLGASTGQVRLLRGVAAYFRQETETAVSELEQAVKLLPESVAARALLIASYIDYGQGERSGPLYLGLKELAPVSDEDFLFKGYCLGLLDPLDGLPELNEGIRRHDSPLGRALRAALWVEHSQRTGSLESAKKALADAAVARGMLPDNQFVIYVHLYARMAAAALYPEARKPDERIALLRDAARDVQALEPSIGRPSGIWMIWRYYIESGSTDEALSAARRSFRQSQGSISAFCCATSLYMRGEFEEALRYLDQRRPQDAAGNMLRLFVMAELPDGVRRVHEGFDGSARNYWGARVASLLLLGDKSDAQEAIRRTPPPPTISKPTTDAGIALRRFSNGEISESEYLASVAGDRRLECNAHFYVGLFRLAEGNRSAAKDHFAKAVQTHVMASFNHSYSLMFLTRSQTDPNWPPWIPVKK
jgi:tetratricopeptide (TPR) repeat protein